MDDVILTHHTGADAASLLSELSDVYADAYGVEPRSGKTAAFERRATAQFGRDGFAFGYTLPAGDTHWWGGVMPQPPADFPVERGTRTWVLSEIEMRRDWQGRGWGRAIHDAVLRDRPEERATLATGPDATTQRVYEGWGWRRVGRVPGTRAVLPAASWDGEVTYEVEHMRFLRPDVVAVKVRQIYHAATGDTEGAPLYVMTKRDEGRWLLHACQNTEVRIG